MGTNPSGTASGTEPEAAKQGAASGAGTRLPHAKTDFAHPSIKNLNSRLTLGN